MQLQVKHDNNERDGCHNFKDANGAVVVRKLFDGLLNGCLGFWIVVMLEIVIGLIKAIGRPNRQPGVTKLAPRDPPGIADFRQL